MREAPPSGHIRSDCGAVRLCLVFCLLGTTVACQSESPEEPAVKVLTQAQLMDPATCQGCHPKHFEEWSGSMHAYASIDPVFLAMNQRAQRQTGGDIGDFCVKCHAPVAVALGLTEDGLNLESVPDYAQGVTCFACHSVDGISQLHNNGLVLATDGVLRGGIKDPVENPAHASAYSPHLDREALHPSSDLCGSCHDIVNGHGVHLERTYAEWNASLYAKEDPAGQQSCGQCHTRGRDDVAAEYPGVPIRRVHNHQMVGVDVALTDFPQKAQQRARIQRELSFSLASLLCVRSTDGMNDIEVALENIGVGHSWPSGATFDRRAWVELVAYDESGQVIFESGVVGDDEPLRELDDPQLWELGSRGFDADGRPTNDFWDIVRLESEVLPAPTAFSMLDPDYTDIHRRKFYRFAGAVPAAVSLRVLIRPLGLDVLDELIHEGDLDPAYRALIPTFELGFTQVEWFAEDGDECVPVGHQDFYDTGRDQRGTP